jgi:hypothetical protein
MLSCGRDICRVADMYHDLSYTLRRKVTPKRLYLFIVNTLYRFKEYNPKVNPCFESQQVTHYVSFLRTFLFKSRILTTQEGTRSDRRDPRIMFCLPSIHTPEK